ncbi:hypothetical protein ACF1HJ_10845 [Streptomyces sp. NPDC013978]|uniref:hypothetical protein n=1 Tax=Streptomyces sp. NPDC013978 TaxID=3364869 RepID=UPI00370014CF
MVDWEMATLGDPLGDPLADLGLHLAHADPAFAPVLSGWAASTSDRLPTRADLAQRYARASGRDLGDLGFCLALGLLQDRGHRRGDPCPLPAGSDPRFGVRHGRPRRRVPHRRRPAGPDPSTAPRSDAEQFCAPKN